MSKVVICVLKSGGEYDVDYVHHLKEGVEKYSNNVRFICLTDLPEIKGVEILPLECNLAGWWSKLELFKPSLDCLEDFLYIDLDTIIVSNIEQLFKGARNTALRDMYAKINRPEWNTNIGSGVMKLSKELRQVIWKEWVKSPEKHIEEAGRYGDQRFLQRWLVKFPRLQDLYPKFFISYKGGNVKNISFPKETKMVVFHGQPRPREVNWLDGHT